MRKLMPLLAAALCLLAGRAHALPLDKLKLPPGFSIAVYAEGVRDARSLALGPDGTVYVSTRSNGNVYALPDRNGDRRADEVIVVASGLDTPNGIDLHDGALYVVENRRVLRFADIARRLRDKPKPDVIYDKLPDDNSHGWRYARFGPDGKLYIAVGAPCNICKPDPERYGLIGRMRPDGTEWEIYARGIRNSVGFDWHPQTHALWFTDNGRDYLGDDKPPDELNHAPKPGLHFGYPYCHAGTIPDPQYGKERPCGESTPPARALTPHGAALGLRFYTGQSFPARYRGGIFIAEHGSWNRSDPIGYRLMFVPLKNGQAAGYEVFAEGWLAQGGPWGRPVDVLVMPDGALLVSDDHSGTVYRISYTRP